MSVIRGIRVVRPIKPGSTVLEAVFKIEVDGKVLRVPKLLPLGTAADKLVWGTTGTGSLATAFAIILRLFRNEGVQHATEVAEAFYRWLAEAVIMDLDPMRENYVADGPGRHIEWERDGTYLKNEIAAKYRKFSEG